MYFEQSMTIRLLTLFISAVAVLNSCTSGKSALKQGDYYDAVLQAVNRLRQNPDHKKSREVLAASYQMAIDYLETDAQNQIASNANFKWRNAVGDYEKINNLYEQIRTSPGALKVIPKPVNKYKELTDVKNKAAEETYEAAILYMLKNTRDDAKRAYFLFQESNSLSPGYRESVEMMEQSKFNATLKVVVEPALRNYYDWNFEPVIFGVDPNQFVKFYTPRQAQDAGLTQIDQFIRLVVNGYSESKPSFTKSEAKYQDSVKVDEKTVNGQKVPVYEKISGSIVTFEKKITSRGSITLFIKDANSQVELRNSELIAEEGWVDRWANCSGDQRAIPQTTRKLCGTKEPYMAQNYLLGQSKKNLDNKLAQALTNFYDSY